MTQLPRISGRECITALQKVGFYVRRQRGSQMNNVTAQTAQRQVTKLLLDQVGNLLYGERPNLVAGERLLWRVPIWLALPTTGPLGQVGTLDVDTETGEILFTQQLLEEIAEHGNALAKRSTLLI